MNGPVRHITLIGSGNVAGYLGHLLFQKGYAISTVISRNNDSGIKLAKELKAQYSDIYAIQEPCDLVLIAVNDDSIASVAAQLKGGDFLICHTAGAVSLDVLEGFQNRAVAYPLQTIKREIVAEEVPMLVEGGSIESLAAIQELMQNCGFHTHQVSSADRRYYHLAAVFANNFSVAMLAASEKIAELNGLDPELLKPLVKRTFENVQRNTATVSQTGPAMRRDQATIQKHLALLESDAVLQDIYRTVSEFIASQKK